MTCGRLYVEYSHVLLRETADFAHVSVTCVVVAESKHIFLCYVCAANTFAERFDNDPGTYIPSDIEVF